MIYKFRIVSSDVDDFRRDIIIDSESTFLEFRDIICESTGYSTDQMSSFHTCNRDWENQEEITLEDLGLDFSRDLYIMKDTHLSDLINDEGDLLKFTFDNITDRSLFIQLKEVIPGKNLLQPECILSIGKAPSQNVDLDEFDAAIDAKAAQMAADMDLDEDFYGSTDFNEDELDYYDDSVLD